MSEQSKSTHDGKLPANPTNESALRAEQKTNSGSGIEVAPVTTGSQRKAFLKLPWDLHSGDPNWTPPIRYVQKQLVNYSKHPFYENAEIQTFIATKNGRTVGRIGAIIDHRHNEHYDENRGMFGFFESINDQQVADALLDAAKEWLDRKGIKCMRGPMNPSMNYECGLLIEGFDSPATFLMTYNPEYYPKLIDNYGMVKAQDLFAYYGHASMLDTLDPKIKFVTEEAAKRLKVEVRPISRKNFNEEVSRFMEVYNNAVLGNWGFVPMSASEMKHQAAGLKALIVPELTSLAEVEGKTVGFIFGLLDYNPLIKKMDGRMFPFGFLRILFQKKTIKRLRLVSTNVTPEFQKWGLVMVLLQDLLDRAIVYGTTEAEFSWVLESNKLSRGSLERGGAHRIKTYRIYDLDW